MKVELRRFSTNARLSQETVAFAADVWVDGKKAGTAENDGHGGSTFVHITDSALREALNTKGKSEMPAEFKHTSGIEWLIDGLVEAELQRRHDAAQARKLAKIDAQEKARYSAHGYNVARLRHADTWRWFGFKPGTDPKVTADTIATKYKVAVDEIVVL